MISFADQPTSSSSTSVPQLVRHLREADQDFEFYPTTNEIIDKLIEDVNESRQDYLQHRFRDLNSVLDIGAGHGKVLSALKARGGFEVLYAIEKSSMLCDRLPADVFIVGTDLLEQSLISKQVDVIFSNPPYSDFEAWSTKIIKEAGCKFVYLVIPERWQQSRDIAQALAFRDSKAKVVGSFSFENSEDRAARARVHLVKIRLHTHQNDAFERFFDEHFAEFRAKFTAKKADHLEDSDGIDPGNRRQRFERLVVGANYPDRMVALYDQEMDNVRRNYDLVSKLDTSLLLEFGIMPKKVMECLSTRLSGLRHDYWHELFNRMTQVTDRLAASQRKRILRTLQENVGVDFTVPNIHAIIMWVLKNANVYMEEQLIELVEGLADKANVRAYKSNLKPFVYDRWRYTEDKPTHYVLEYRIVAQHVGGIRQGYSFERGLADSAADFIGDLLTVANNLGFRCDAADPRLQRLKEGGREAWLPNTRETFYLSGESEQDPIVEVRAFLNGNLHLRLNQAFALALNVEYGRLKGWLHSGAEAAEELGEKDAPKYFGHHLQLGRSSLLMI